MEKKAVVVSPKHEVPSWYGSGLSRLGCLRPKDEFQFVREVPYEGMDLETMYRVLPAQRGIIKFTDGESAVYSVPQDYALDIPVQSQFFRREKRYYFYPGDKIKSRETGAIGCVEFARGQGYMVLFEGRKVAQWVPDGMLMLIEKDQTTLSYVQYDGVQDRFSVGYGGIRSDFETAVEGLKWLYEHNRPAHHRLSLFVSRLIDETDAEVFQKLAWVDDSVLEWFYERDSKVWNDVNLNTVFNVLKRHWESEDRGTTE